MSFFKSDNLTEFIILLFSSLMMSSYVLAEDDYRLDQLIKNHSATSICTDAWNNIQACAHPSFYSFRNITSSYPVNVELWYSKFPIENTINYHNSRIFTSFKSGSCKKKRKNKRTEIARLIFGPNIPDLAFDFRNLSIDLDVSTSDNRLYISNFYMGYRNCFK